MWTSKNRAVYDRSKLPISERFDRRRMGMVEPLILPGKTGVESAR